MMDFLVGGALIFLVFFVTIALVSCKGEARKTVVENDISRLDMNYTLTTLLRSPVDGVTLADVLAQRTYGEDVEEKVAAAVKAALPDIGDAWSMWVIIDGDWKKVYSGGGIISSFNVQGEARAIIPTANNKPITVVLIIK